MILGFCLVCRYDIKLKKALRGLIDFKLVFT